MNLVPNVISSESYEPEIECKIVTEPKSKRQLYYRLEDSNKQILGILFVSTERGLINKIAAMTP